MVVSANFTTGLGISLLGFAIVFVALLVLSFLVGTIAKIVAKPQADNLFSQRVEPPQKTDQELAAVMAAVFSILSPNQDWKIKITQI